MHSTSAKIPVSTSTASLEPLKCHSRPPQVLKLIWKHLHPLWHIIALALKLTGHKLVNPFFGMFTAELLKYKGILL